jgi:hypothetical protein
MLLWINGPFGGGKTQTAFELHRRLPGSVVCDPELAGFGLHRMMPLLPASAAAVESALAAFAEIHAVSR